MTHLFEVEYFAELEESLCTKENDSSSGGNTWIVLGNEGCQVVVPGVGIAAICHDRSRRFTSAVMYSQANRLLLVVKRFLLIGFLIFFAFKTASLGVLCLGHQSRRNGTHLPEGTRGAVGHDCFSLMKDLASVNSCPGTFASIHC